MPGLDLRAAPAPTRAADGPRLTIDLGAIRTNFDAMRARHGGTVASAVVKSDAYGLGLEPVARTLAAAGCDTFWVNDAGEAARLLACVPGATVFALHGLGAAAPAEVAAAGAVPVLTSLEEIERCAAAARAGETAGRPLPVAVQLDTGLGRLGLDETQVDALAAQPDLLAPLDLRCWVTHLAAFDLPDAPSNRDQRQRLADWTARLPAAPISLASSSALYRSADWHFDIARIGSALYGIQTSIRRQDGLVPCYRLTAPVLRVADLPAGRALGYRGAATLTRDSRIATLPIGYANGLPQALAEGGRARVAGATVPFVGGVSMNLAMLDVTDLPPDAVVPGSEAVVFDADTPIEPAARLAACAPNAILTALGAGTPRVYVDGADRY